MAQVFFSVPEKEELKDHFIRGHYLVRRPRVK